MKQRIQVVLSDGWFDMSAENPSGPATFSRVTPDASGLAPGLSCRVLGRRRTEPFSRGSCAAWPPTWREMSLARSFSARLLVCVASVNGVRLSIAPRECGTLSSLASQQRPRFHFRHVHLGNRAKPGRGLGRTHHRHGPHAREEVLVCSSYIIVASQARSGAA